MTNMTKITETYPKPAIASMFPLHLEHTYHTYRSRDVMIGNENECA